VDPTKEQAEQMARLAAALRKIIWESTRTELLAILGLGPDGTVTVIAATDLHVSPAALERAYAFCDAIAVANNVQDCAE
jgi:hypothetical protein